MKKAIKTLCVVAIALFAIPQHADAQFFKKLKEAAKSVVKETIETDPVAKEQKAATPNAAAGPKFIASANGVSIANPAMESFDLEFVEAVGNSAANTVTIVVKATAKDLNYANARIGDNNVTAYDSDGNEYKSNNGTGSKNLTVGIPIKFEFSELVNVPAKVSVLPVVYTTYYINSAKSSRAGNLSTYVQLKNVPVTWK